VGADINLICEIQDPVIPDLIKKNSWRKKRVAKREFLFFTLDESNTQLISDKEQII